jgi:hypothetical protein
MAVPVLIGTRQRLIRGDRRKIIERGMLERIQPKRPYSITPNPLFQKDFLKGATRLEMLVAPFL